MSEEVLKNVLGSLDIMWKGMLGLFIICGAIAVMMMIVAKCTKGTAEKQG
ncbi:hypothetical protein FACS1894172_07570 [Spirochaetia bacterium]|nr:hypothetical protein FACS1894164_02300 [Spirochaetia bacterium]GHU31892.1 hypothetical protein FACS1894172_07570 [Spirochaetia bacterium]